MSADTTAIPVTVTRSASAAPRLGDGGPEAPRAAIAPLIDIHEGPDGLVLEADVPGVSESDVRIELQENVLNLTARAPSSAPAGARPLYEEYPDGNYRRSFILSAEVERGRIAAELHNGVLRLVLPKAERARTHRIEIKS